MTSCKVDLILVTYNPDIGVLVRNIKSIEQQVRQIIIVDNCSTRMDLSVELNQRFNQLKIILCNENLGIAEAQNIGIQYSLARNSDYILLSDQDTVFPKNYVNKMLPAFAVKPKVAAVSPIFHDIVRGKINSGFLVLSRFGFSKIFPSEGIHDINHAIASGLIIKADFIEYIGLMNSDLFIDWVDYQWCWMALNKGYFLLGNADVVIEHHLGDSAIDIGGRSIGLRSVKRHYYITRNAFYLATRCKDLDALHRATLFFKSFGYLFGYPALAKPRFENLKMTTLGFYHGLIGRLGRLD